MRNERVASSAELGLHAHDAAGGRERPRRERRSREQPPAAARDEQQVERTRLLDQLARRACPGPRSRRRGRRAGSAPDRRPCAGAPRLPRASRAPDRSRRSERRSPRSRARLARGAFCGITIVACAPSSRQASADRLRVVARRVREHAARALLRAEPRHGVVGAAELEGAHPLQVLALQEETRPEPLVERARRRDGRAVRDPLEALCGGLNVLEAHHVQQTLADRGRSCLDSAGGRWSSPARDAASAEPQRLETPSVRRSRSVGTHPARGRGRGGGQEACARAGARAAHRRHAGRARRDHRRRGRRGRPDHARSRARGGSSSARGPSAPASPWSTRAAGRAATPCSAPGSR